MALSQVGLERLNTATTKKIGTNKNLIINGAMQVAQRGTSSTTSGYGSVDRFQILSSNVDEAPTHAQVDLTSSDTGPYESGFRKGLKITNGNQTSGAGASDFIKVQQNIEGQNIVSSGWNAADPNSKLTISYWVKSSVAQTFYGRFRAFASSDYEYTYSFALSANTWTKVTKTVPGNSNFSSIPNTNASGFYHLWQCFFGTDFTNNKTLDQWAVKDNANKSPDMTSTWYTTNNATFELTGVQLEVGSLATDFEFKSFPEELNLCKRYCQVRQTDVSSGSPFTRFAPAIMQTTSSVRAIFHLIPAMRAIPSGAISGNFQIFPATGFSSGSFALESGTSSFNTAIMQQSSGMSGTAGSAHYFSANGDATAKVTFDAEL
jgi:hypothetical protein